MRRMSASASANVSLTLHIFHEFKQTNLQVPCDFRLSHGGQQQLQVGDVPQLGEAGLAAVWGWGGF